MRFIRNLLSKTSSQSAEPTRGRSNAIGTEAKDEQIKGVAIQKTIGPDLERGHFVVYDEKISTLHPLIAILKEGKDDVESFKQAIDDFNSGKTNKVQGRISGSPDDSLVTLRNIGEIGLGRAEDKRLGHGVVLNLPSIAAHYDKPQCLQYLLDNKKTLGFSDHDFIGACGIADRNEKPKILKILGEDVQVQAAVEQEMGPKPDSDYKP